MSKALCAAILVAIGSYVAPASAVTISSTTTLGDITGVSVNIGNSFGAASSGSSFADTYVFSLSGLAQTVGTTVTINLNVPPISFQLNNMVISLTDSTGSTVFASDSVPVNNTLQVSALLAPGSTYHFLVTGDVAGTSGGSYGGVLAAAPIPEADAYAMMLAGLGLVGLVTRRTPKKTV